MQVCECLDEEQLVKATAGARVTGSKDSSAGREESSSPGGCGLWCQLPQNSWRVIERAKDPGIHRLDKAHLHGNLSYCKGKKEGKRKLVILTVTAIGPSFTNEALGNPHEVTS